MIGKKKYLYFILFAIGLIAILVNTEIVFGVPDQRELYPGDYVRLDGFNSCFVREILKPWFDDKFSPLVLWDLHIAMYDGYENDEHWFFEAGAGGVHRTPYRIIKRIWTDERYFYVINADGEIRENAREKAHEWEGLLYQWSEPLSYAHYDPDEWLQPINWFDPDWRELQFRYVQKLQCAELVWAAYMQETQDPQINIAWGSKKRYDLAYNSDFCYKGVSTHSLSTEENINISEFHPKNPPGENQNNIDIIVDGNFAEDDPVNNQWTTIQKGIDNASSLDVILVKNYNYTDDIVIDKSIKLIGEEVENVGISGSVSVIDCYDYELPDNKITDYLHNVNMAGNEMLMHFNNETVNGEDYGSTSTVYDHSGQGNNGDAF